METYGIFCHLNSFIHRLSLCYTTWQCWNGDGVASLLLVRLQDNSVAVVIHLLILLACFYSKFRRSSIVRPACFKIASSVLGFNITCACLGTVTLVGLVGCFKVTWLPL